MFLTHAFARPESLTRAQDWLTRLGFSPTQIEVFRNGIPRIALFQLDSGQVAKARILFNALDATEPDGPVGYFDARRRALAMLPVEGEPQATARPAFARTVIHFESIRDPMPPEADWADQRRESRRMM